MERDVMDTIKEKRFSELSKQEKEEVMSFCASEEAYNDLRRVLIEANAFNWDSGSPKSETKKRLDELFYSTYPTTAPMWYHSVLAVVVPKDKAFYRQPFVQVAALLLVAVLIYPVFNRKLTAEDQLIAQTEAKEVPLTSEKEPQPVQAKEERMQENTSQNIPEEVGEQPVREHTVESVESDFPVAAHPIGTDAEARLSEWRSDSGNISGDVAADFVHSDGVFEGVVYEMLSQPVSSDPAMLDLLTTTF